MTKSGAAMRKSQRQAQQGKQAPALVVVPAVDPTPTARKPPTRPMPPPPACKQPAAQDSVAGARRTHLADDAEPAPQGEPARSRRSRFTQCCSELLASEGCRATAVTDDCGSLFFLFRLLPLQLSDQFPNPLRGRGIVGAS